MNLPTDRLSSFIIGAGIVRETGKYTTLLIVESMFGLIVALSNMVIIIILLAGWRRFFKVCPLTKFDSGSSHDPIQNPFYIILSNLIVCTSMKAFVELGFVAPYYILQSDGIQKVFQNVHEV